MKRAIVASILGIAASVATVASSQAQGFVTFNTYSTGNALVTYGEGPSIGLAVEDTFKAEVYYALGDVTGSVVFTGLVNPNTSAPSGGGLTLYTGVNNIADFFAGYVFGSDITIPGYVSGPVTFVVVAYSGPDFATSQYRGHSIAFTDTLATGSNPGVAFGPNIDDFQVFEVPEPSTFALAGLGIGSLLFLRRRK